MAVCVIPARGGSKRIPRKNIRSFAGQPMLAWSIQAAQQAGCFDQILVSTDDPEIASLARELGAVVPFVRPPYLADDHTGTSEVIVHAIDHLNDSGYPSSAVCCLYATAPFVRPQDLLEGLALLDKLSDNCFVFSATRYPFPIQRAIYLDRQNRSRMFFPECYSKRSQDLQESYHDAGQFYWGFPQSWYGNRSLFDGSLPLVLPRWRVQDIDTEEDWIRAELMFQGIRGCEQNE